MLLSFALMVKDEKEHLERCLTSTLPFNAEIVVLDTGSSDNTVDIAKKFTNQVFHQKWQDDFSLHRNKSFSLANGEWIFQIDADEQIVFENERTPAIFLEYIQQLPPEVTAVGFPLRDFRLSTNTYAAEFDVARCFRRGTVTYNRKIHNRPDFDGQITYFDAMYLKHYGYDLTEEQRKVKAQRTIRLLLESVEENPNDHESHFYLCQSYKQLNEDNAKSIEYGLKYIEMMKDIPPANFNQAIFHTMAALYFEQGDMEKSGQMIKRGIANNDKNPDLWFDTLKIAVKEKNMKAIASSSQQYVTAIRNLRKTRTTTNLGGQFFFYTDSDSVATGLYYLSMCYLQNGVSEITNLKKILSFCSPVTQQQITERMAQDMGIMQLQDLSENPSSSAEMAAMAFAGK
jgi:glycosyltransferase involved in cell wall biosynthesis